MGWFFEHPPPALSNLEFEEYLAGNEPSVASRFWQTLCTSCVTRIQTIPRGEF